MPVRTTVAREHTQLRRPDEMAARTPRNPFSPGDHYEETMSIGPEAGPRLMSALRELIWGGGPGIIVPPGTARGGGVSPTGEGRGTVAVMHTISDRLRVGASHDKQ